MSLVVGGACQVISFKKCYKYYTVESVIFTAQFVGVVGICS